MIKLLTILTILTMYIPQEVEAGCFPREDITSSVSITPPLDCLNIQAGPGCVGEVELSIENLCEEPLIYIQGKKKVELLTYFYDRDVPQEYIQWSREIYFKNNPAKKILIEVENKPIPEVFQQRNSFYLIISIIAFIGIVSTIILLKIRKR